MSDNTEKNLFTIKVRVIRAKNLRNVEAGLHVLSDPYCKISIQEAGAWRTISKAETQVLKDNLNPDWNFEIFMKLTDPARCTLVIEVKNDAIGPDQDLGKLRLQLVNLRKGVEFERIHELDRSSGGKPSTIQVGITAIDFDSLDVQNENVYSGHLIPDGLKDSDLYQKYDSPIGNKKFLGRLHFPMEKGLPMNWAKTYTISNFKSIVFVQTEADIITAVKTAKIAGSTVRAIGSLYSWGPLTDPGENGILLNLKKYCRIINVDKTKLEVTVEGGATLWDINRRLWELHGLALPNMGNVTGQTIAGVASTGTHGKSRHHSCVSEMVKVWRIVTAERGVIEIHENNGIPFLKAIDGGDISGLDPKDMLSGIGVSLGLLGIISTVTIRVQPKFRLLSTGIVKPFKEAILEIPQLWNNNDWAEFEFYTTSQQVFIGKLNHVTGKSEDEIIKENPHVNFSDGPVRETSLDTFKMVNHTLSVVARNPERTDQIFKIGEFIAAQATKQKAVVGRSYESIAMNDIADILHFEMDLAIPFSSAVPALSELSRYYSESKESAVLPIDVRMAKKDNFWLSPAYGTDVLWLDFLEFRHVEFSAVKKYYDKAREILAKYNYRPHWSKVVRDDVEYLRKAFPKLNAFLALREKLDPNGIFLSPYLVELLGINSSGSARL